jgi:hypothetical protein
MIPKKQLLNSLIVLGIFWLLIEIYHGVENSPEMLANFNATNQSSRSQDIVAFAETNETINKITILFMEAQPGQPLYSSGNAVKACSSRCKFTSDLSLWNESSAVLFHANNRDIKK